MLCFVSMYAGVHVHVLVFICRALVGDLLFALDPRDTRQRREGRLLEKKYNGPGMPVLSNGAFARRDLIPFP